MTPQPSPFLLKVLLLVAAVTLDHYGHLSGAMTALFGVALGGVGLTGAVAAFKASPGVTLAQVETVLRSALSPVLPLLVAPPAQPAQPAQPTLPGVKS